MGQDKALRRLEVLRRRGLAGRAYWISGQSGTGKTTIARLIAAEIADDLHVEELDASDLTPGRLRRWSGAYSLTASDGAVRPSSSMRLTGSGKIRFASSWYSWNDSPPMLCSSSRPRPMVRRDSSRTRLMPIHS